jgi:hypothetical protein
MVTIGSSLHEENKVIAKGSLCQYGYPADMPPLTKESVLQQAEMLSAF